MFSLKFISATRNYSTFHEKVPAPYLRRSFMLKAAQTASITICGLGFYELFVNGNRITKGALAPYIANPDDVLYYDRYDVSSLLVPGENVIGVMLGNGILNCPGGDIWDFQLARYRSAPKLALSFESEELNFEADGQFRCTPSPIYYDDLRVGEFYDARKEIPGWNLPGFDDSAWSFALPAETPRGECRMCGVEPIVVTQELKPVDIRRGNMGVDPNFRNTLPVVEPEGAEALTEGWLYDFGVNTAGICRLKVRGKAGQKIVLQFAEDLEDPHTLNLRPMIFLPKAFNQRVIYICKGEGEEEYVPFFTYQGFRYVLALGLEDGQATSELLTYLVMNSDLRKAGGFECSCDVLNALQRCTEVSDLANFYYFPTDCPHREKNGWTGDAQLSAEQLLLNFTPETSYREWLFNIRKAQRDDGALPGIVPTSGWGFDWGNGPAWDAVITSLPYYIWKYRGDTEVIRENAGAILRYLHYITTKRDSDGLIHIGLGDWCPAGRKGADNTPAPLEVTDTLICMDISSKAAEMYAAIGMEAEAAYAQSIYEGFRNAGRRHLIDFGAMTVRGCCQASQAMGIFHNLFEEAEKPEAFRALVEMIEDNDRLMDVGILGSRALFTTLSRYGRTDLAYEMMTTARYPSFGNWIARGATALWELCRAEGEWNGSLNHHMFGDISRWMIEELAGLKVHSNGLNTLTVSPRFIDALDHASAWHDAPAGRMAVSWKRDGEDILLTVEAPEGVTGQILLERGWKHEDGMRAKPVASGEYRIIPVHKKDSGTY